MAEFRGTDFNDQLRLGTLPLSGLLPLLMTKDGVPIPPIALTEADLEENDTILGFGGADRLDGGRGNDRIAAGDGNDNPVNGGDGNDTLEGGAGDDLLNGDAGNDSLIGGADNDNLNGHNGDDTLEGGLGNNIIDGGEGDETGGDYLSYQNVGPTSGAGSVTVDLGAAVEGLVNPGLGTDDVVAGTVENVVGAPGLINNLTGDGDDNILVGGAANDDISGGGGSDTLRGGNGSDFYTVAVATGGGTRIEDTGGNSDFLNLGGATVLAQGPTTTGIGLERRGTDLAIDIDASGDIDPQQDIVIADFYADTTGDAPGVGLIENVANLTDDEILAADIPNTFNPPGSTVIWTTPAADPADPGPDESRQTAPFGGNTAFTDDRGVAAYVFTNNADTGAEGNVPGTATARYIQGLNGNDVITGTPGADNINGNRGNDRIDGSAGGDGDRSPILAGNVIRTALRGGKGSDTIDGNTGDDLLNGNLGNDTAIGGPGDDIVRGGQDDDVLIGGPGEDYLIGDKGRDLLIGGFQGSPDGQRDIFVLPGSAAAAATAGEADVIGDFEDGVDQIMLPEGVTFAQLQIDPVQLQVDGGAAVTSAAVRLNGTYLAIASGVAPASLQAEDFVASDNNILLLG
ncbi:calcium-binding protein [Lyngbya sp. CCY1209]|uniref:calcium-binding protein n=1 Tax=Lyngbya sp. CCY1209 TaxID=2886103 RepID=UPI002D20A364|nr:calcium-binding protein [Lyngbya sp. CCY1209]MEB3883326.1 hypothetical protein [Lyngbya sp. CCY1209]